MADRDLLFEIFRLNVVDEEVLSFEFMGERLRGDAQILRVVEHVSDSDISVPTQSGRTTFEWHVRNFSADEEPAHFCAFTLARATVAKDGQTITPDGFEEATTTFLPPPVDTVNLVFYLDRHLVAVEYRSEVMKNQLWRHALHSMLDISVRQLGFVSSIRLEPVPQSESILRAFRSFDRLTRLRVKLRIPNPELDRRTERLRREMVDDEIREYTQDMHNPAGLSLSEDGRPFASAAMAQAGYKEGDVTMVGYKNGKRAIVRTGSRAARIRLDGLRDFIRGASVNLKTAEAKRTVGLISEEIDRIIEIPELPLGDGDGAPR